MDVSIIAGIVFVVIVILLFLMNQFRLSKFYRAMELMAQERFDESLKVFEQIPPSTSNDQTTFYIVHAKAYMNYRQGHAAEALKILDKIDNPRDTEMFIAFQSLRAECHCSEGNLTAAEESMNLITSKANSSHDYITIIPQVMILAQQKKFREIGYLLDVRFAGLESKISVKRFKALRLLWAFAMQSTASSMESQKLVAGIFPHTSGEFDYLAVNWPELKVFLKQHNLSAANAAA